MSEESSANPKHDTNEIETDSLSSGVSYMMALTVAQRGMGFVRTALFCRLLPEEELGQWSLIFSFIIFASPLTLMGITGSFGRYVEYYLQQGQVRRFFRRTGFAVASLTAVAICLVCLNRDWVAWALFGSSEQSSLLLPACLTLTTNIAYYFVFETAIALRRVKVGSKMDLISSWTFALLGITLVSLTNLGSAGVVLSFAAGNVLGGLYGMSVLTGIWKRLPQSEDTFTHASLWKKLAPFAFGLWMVNVIYNLFDLADRYMIVHFSGVPALEAQGLVGQYFSSMAVPMLLVGVSTTLAHLVMPYLSEDWEAGRKEAVNARVNLSIKLTGLMLGIGSVLIVVCAPILFDVVFGGKYDAGRQVLPFTIALCYWAGLFTMVTNYMFCVERPKLICFATAVGLVANITLNALLLPHFGLVGAGFATATGCFLNVSLCLFLATRFGFRMHNGVYWALLFPIACGFGSFAAMAALTGLMIVALKTNWFLTAEERGDLEQILASFAAKVLPGRFGSKASATH